MVQGTCMLSHARLFETAWTAARQAPLSAGLSRQECWRVLPCRPPGEHPHPGIELTSPVSLTWEALLLLL